MFTQAFDRKTTTQISLLQYRLRENDFVFFLLILREGLILLCLHYEGTK